MLFTFFYKTSYLNVEVNCTVIHFSLTFSLFLTFLSLSLCFSIFSHFLSVSNFFLTLSSSLTFLPPSHFLTISHFSPAVSSSLSHYFLNIYQNNSFYNFKFHFVIFNFYVVKALNKFLFFWL
jgi:hypothetical protein